MNARIENAVRQLLLRRGIADLDNDFIALLDRGVCSPRLRKSLDKNRDVREVFEVIFDARTKAMREIGVIREKTADSIPTAVTAHEPAEVET